MPRISSCSPPARSAADAVVAHSPSVGSEGGIRYRLFLAFCRAIALAALSASFSSCRFFFSSRLKYSLVVPITAIATSAMATPVQTTVTISVDGTSIPLLPILALIVSWTLVSLAIFHWLLVPFFDWVARRFS